MNLQLDCDKQTELHNQIIQILAKEGCTVLQAKTILERVSRTISGTAPVQFVPVTDYEF